MNFEQCKRIAEEHAKANGIRLRIVFDGVDNVTLRFGSETPEQTLHVVLSQPSGPKLTDDQPKSHFATYKISEGYFKHLLFHQYSLWKVSRFYGGFCITVQSNSRSTSVTWLSGDRYSAATLLTPLALEWRTGKHKWKELLAELWRMAESELKTLKEQRRGSYNRPSRMSSLETFLTLQLQMQLSSYENEENK